MSHRGRWAQPFPRHRARPARDHLRVYQSREFTGDNSATALSPRDWYGALVQYRLPKRPMQRVSAMVIDLDGRPVAGVKVRLGGYAEDGAVVFGDAVTPANGRVAFADLTPGDYELTAEAPGCPVTVKVAGWAAKIVVPMRNGACGVEGLR